eukprot:5642501-Lingulodinium_polyedra.AAC.1
MSIFVNHCQLLPKKPTDADHSVACGQCPPTPANAVQSHPIATHVFRSCATPINVSQNQALSMPFHVSPYQPVP